MNQKKQLSILEFSRLTGISRDNLRFYDRIGLLCPEQRGENNYRYYARSQLNSCLLYTSLVVGDIIHLSAGDMVPADVRVLEAKDLFISQSALTGAVSYTHLRRCCPHWFPSGRSGFRACAKGRW